MQEELAVMCFSRTWNIGNCPPNQTRRPASTREEKNAEEEQVEEEMNKEEEEEEEEEEEITTTIQSSKEGQKGTALDLKVCSCNPAKWIVDMVWLNLVEQSKFPQFSKAGEGVID